MRAHYGNSVSATANRIIPGSYRYFRAATLLCSSRVAPPIIVARARARVRENAAKTSGIRPLNGIYYAPREE